MTDDLLHALEAKIDLLLHQCQRLSEENQALKAREAEWSIEQQRLTEKNEMARTRVDAMISRLKNLESES